MRTAPFLLGTFLLLASWATNGLTQSGQAGASLKDTSTKDAPREAVAKTPVQPKRIPLAVVLEGTDQLGERLVFHLKEALAKSGQFVQSDKDEKKLKLFIHSREEFKDRPNQSSVYAATWLYSESEAVLKYHLTSGVYFAHSPTIREEAEALLGRTAETASRYAHLFE